MTSKNKKQIAAKIERLSALADRLNESERRKQTVALIEELNVELQAEK